MNEPEPKSSIFGTINKKVKGLDDFAPTINTDLHILNNEVQQTCLGGFSNILIIGLMFYICLT